MQIHLHVYAGFIAVFKSTWKEGMRGFEFIASCRGTEQKCDKPFSVLPKQDTSPMKAFNWAIKRYQEILIHLSNLLKYY